MDDSLASLFIGQDGPDVRRLDGLGLALARMGAGPTGGLPPHGLRHGGNGAKGLGFFGPMAMQDGSYATEMSADDDVGQFPLIVPTLDRAELAALLSGQEPTAEMMAKAQAFANQRRAAGRDTFMEQGELRYPLPSR
jgi:hypothetical protein